MSIFAAFVKGLGKTREAFTRRVETLFNRGQADAEFFDELEEILITADIGVDFAMKAIARIKEEIKNKDISGTGEIKELLKSIILEALGPEEDIRFAPNPPTVILVLGVNGVGKTTTIGKLAYLLKKEKGKKVLLGAGDTFRAAAVEQLSEWARRGGADIVAHQTGGDPGSVIFDAISAAVSRGT
ncbi:MAG TPA: signal recognition particle-docking protein FtsY, partial [Firmicutes bacterium]|nr:signal recognition particle-docking protein FtsY [Bacillota bacterium]